MHNCGNGMGGFGGAQMAIIQVPFSLVGSGSGSGSGGGAVVTASGVAYVPPAGSPLTGQTDAGKAFDKIGDLLKVLNATGFTAGNDGTIPVYDATTGAFVPTAAEDLLSPAAMAELMKDLYAAGATGAILQKQPNGTIVAVPFSDALKASFPTATNGQVLKYDGTDWIATTDAGSAADVLAALVAMPTGVPATLTGISAGGTGVKATPAQIVASGVSSAPASTTANPIVKVSGVDAAGAGVSATPAQIVASGVSGSPTSTTANPIVKVSGVDGAGAGVSATPAQIVASGVSGAPAATAANPIASVSGVDATGAAVKSTPAQTLAAGVSGATASTTANPPAFVGGVDATGAATKTAAVQIGAVTNSAAPLTTATTAILTTIATVTVPKDGLYLVDIYAYCTRAVLTPVAAPAAGTIAVARTVIMVESSPTPSPTPIYNSGYQGDVPYTSAMAAGTTLKDFLDCGVVGARYLTAGMILKLNAITDMASGGMTQTFSATTRISLIHLGGVAIG